MSSGDYTVTRAKSAQNFGSRSKFYVFKTKIQKYLLKKNEKVKKKSELSCIRNIGYQINLVSEMSGIRKIGYQKYRVLEILDIRNIGYHKYGVSEAEILGIRHHTRYIGY